MKLKLLIMFLKEKNGKIIKYLIVLAAIGVISAFLFPGLSKNIEIWFNDMVCNVNKGIESSDES